MAALHLLLPTGESIRTQEFRFQTNLPSPARRGSRSRLPLRRPRPLRFERLRVPVWNPYSRGRLGPAKSEDPKGGEGKVDANLTNFLSTDAAGGTPTRRHALGRLPTPPPSARKSATQTAQKTALCASCEHPGGFGIRKSASNSGHTPLGGSGFCSMHYSIHYSLQCSTHCRPSLFAARLVSIPN